MNSLSFIIHPVVEVPGQDDFHFDFGLPHDQAYAFRAETMTLALEGRFEDHTSGRNITSSRVTVIVSIAKKHGFLIGVSRSFDRTVTHEHIKRIRGLVYLRH